MNVGLVFGIIFAAIVIVLLLIFGGRYIQDIFVISCESQVGQRIVDIEKAVKSTYTLSQGSYQELRVMMPDCMEKVCFVDPDNPELDNPAGDWESSEFMTDLVSRYKYNVLMIRPSGGVDGYKIDKMKPYVNFCLTSTKTVILRNKGSLVDITLPEF